MNESLRLIVSTIKSLVFLVLFCVVISCGFPTTVPISIFNAILSGISDADAQETSVTPLVKAIDIVGLKRIEEGAIKNKLTQAKGEPLSIDKVREDIKVIYQMGYFDDVRVDTDFYEGGLKLTYIVKEKPTIVEIGFFGNEEFEDEKLKEKITVVKGSIADTSLIQDNIKKLKDFYDSEGYYLSSIFPVFDYKKESEVSLTFEIKEGPKIKIRKLEIVGNNNISEGKVKKAIKTATWWIFSFFTGSGYVKQDELEEDISNIQNLYLDNGYLNVKVSKPKVIVNEEDQGITVVFEIQEGDQYKVSDVSLDGYHAFPDESLKGLIKINNGDIFSKKVLTENISAIADYYSERGYAASSVTPELVPDESTKNVRINLHVEEGGIYHIGFIEVEGNVKTRDKVVRREITVDEGELYNSKKLKKSYENVNNLDFFETVDLSPKPHPDENIVDIDVKVKEKSTGFISFGGGYSSVDRLIGMIQLTQKNLWGSGQYLRVGAELGGKSSLYEINYTEPWLMDRPITLSGSIYKLDRQFIKYSRRAAGFAMGLSKRFDDIWEIGNLYRFEVVNVFDLDEDAPKIAKDQEGKSTTSSMTPSITRDTRDNYLDPTEGSRNNLYVTFAGIGGTNYFLKSGVDSMWYFPFIGTTTYSIRGRYSYATGISGHELPVYERYYVGGINTIRGLAFGEGGPTDSEGTYIGGTSQVLVNNEFIYPILTEIKLKGVFFVDTGTSYAGSLNFSDIKYTAGTGIRWMSPFGPIRIEYGHNLRRKEGESTGRVEFSFGSFF